MCTDGLCGATDCKNCYPFGSDAEDEDIESEVKLCNYGNCLNSVEKRCLCCGNGFCNEHINPYSGYTFGYCLDCADNI